MLQVITPTGDRPEAWKLCQLWMARQDYAGPVAWHVVDDGRQPMPADFARDGYALHMHRLEPMAGNSQARNLLHLLDKINPRFPVVCWEDDDHYAPDWLETCERELRDCELIGERHTRYFNVATGRGREMTNRAHASLCATAMRGRALDVFRDVLRKHSARLDMELWRRCPGRLLDSHKVVGIKGLPGRGGIGVGHRGTFGEPMRLRDWIGSDAEAYGHG